MNNSPIVRIQHFPKRESLYGNTPSNLNGMTFVRGNFPKVPQSASPVMNLFVNSNTTCFFYFFLPYFAFSTFSTCFPFAFAFASAFIFIFPEFFPAFFHDLSGLLIPVLSVAAFQES
jgi:hypothetical protein